MVKKGNWFSSIKKTLSPSSKQKKSQKSEKKEEHPSVPSTSTVEHAGGSDGSHSFTPPEEVTPLVVEVEPPQAASRAPAAVSAAAAGAQYSGTSREEVAAVRIQTVFRGYLARRALWGLRGLVRLKTVVDGPSVKRQTVNTLKYTQSLSHLQYQISSRRIRMLEENRARQKLHRAKEMANLQNEDEWNDSVQSKEEIEAKLLNKYEATMRRERAMAYSFSHQRPWKKAVGTTNMLFMDPANPQWGWSWAERCNKEPATDHASVKTGINITKSEIAKSYARHQLNSAPTTPRSKPKPGPSPRAHGLGPEGNADDDSKSVTSVKSERNGYRRRSVGSTVAAKAKSQVENGGAKKHLSFPSKPRRHSGPPKVETNVLDGLEHGGVE